MLACSTALAIPTVSPAEEPVFEPQGTHNLFGMTGLIDMPTAEMQPDGQVTVTAGYNAEGYLRNTLSAQLFPGVEGAFRYSVLDDLAGSPTNPTTLYDRSFDLKLRVLTEGNYRPAMVIGLQDFLGTGNYAGEYVALTKNFLEGDLTVTGGFGWGRFDGGPLDITNPLSRISDRFEDRQRSERSGGEVEADQFFRGEDMGFFGGLQYNTPIEGLTLKAELSSDDYNRERGRGFDRKWPVNLGAEYEVYRGIHLGAYYLYGNNLGLRLSVSANPFRPLFEDDLEPGPLPLTPRPLPEDAGSPSLLGEIRTAVSGGATTTRFSEAGLSDVTVEERDGLRWATATLPPSADYTCPDQAATAIDAEFGVIDAVTFVHADGTIVCSVALRPAGEQAMAEAVRSNVDYPVGWFENEEVRAKLIAALEEQLEPDRIGLFGIELAPHTVEVYVENEKFREWPRAVGRTARALSRTLPPSVEVFKIVTVQNSLPVTAIYLERSVLEAAVNRPDGDREVWLQARIEDAEKPDWSEVTGTLEQFPRYDWSLSPDVPFSLFDPDDPLRFDVVADLNGRVEFMPGLSASGSVTKRLFGQFDEIERGTNSDLERVRSNFKRYIQEGDPGIERLTTDYVTKLDDDIYGRVSAGLLEGMHGGVSTEVLWKPVEQSWGLGLEVNWSKQRDFDRLFGFLEHEIFTGHASLYWDTGWHGLFAQVDAGRYLARDWGATFTLKRRFANGWELGGFFTLTDVPFDVYGEGSFDKGILLTVPFNWFLPIESRRDVNVTLRPLTRDGGQRLQVANRLYPMVQDLDEQALETDWGSFWN